MLRLAPLEVLAGCSEVGVVRLIVPVAVVFAGEWLLGTPSNRAGVRAYVEVRLDV